MLCGMVTNTEVGFGRRKEHDKNINRDKVRTRGAKSRERAAGDIVAHARERCLTKCMRPDKTRLKMRAIVGKDVLQLCKGTNLSGVQPHLFVYAATRADLCFGAQLGQFVLSIDERYA